MGLQLHVARRRWAVWCLTLAALVGVSFIPATAVAHAATTYSLVSLDATVTGTSVVARATVRASTGVTAQNAGICVRDAANINRDFPSATNVWISTSGTALTSPAKTFAAGSYRYFACLKVAGNWYNVGAAKTFAVGTTPPPAGSPLAHWSAALNDRANRPATWLAMGDSITEGQGASSRDNRWITRTLNGLRAAYPTAGVVGGTGYLPGWYAVFGPDSPWTPYSARPARSAAPGSARWACAPPRFARARARRMR